MERVKVKKAKKETILWKDSKTILGIRVPTEQYTLTGTKLSVRRGIFSIRDDECQLYNVYDIKLERSFLNRLLATGYRNNYSLCKRRNGFSTYLEKHQRSRGCKGTDFRTGTVRERKGIKTTIKET